MIYNLAQFLITNLPSIAFVVNGWNVDYQDQIMISETGGDPNHWYDRTDWTVQILSRARDVNVAKENIESVYNLLKNRFGLKLPQVTVNTIVYPELKTYQISPIQTPSYIGATEEHFEMFSFNLTITTK